MEERKVTAPLASRNIYFSRPKRSIIRPAKGRLRAVIVACRVRSGLAVSEWIFWRRFTVSEFRPHRVEEMQGRLIRGDGALSLVVGRIGKREYFVSLQRLRGKGNGSLCVLERLSDCPLARVELSFCDHGLAERSHPWDGDWT